MPKSISILSASSQETTPVTTAPSFRTAHAALISIFLTLFNAAVVLFFASVVYEVMGKRVLFSLGATVLLTLLLISLLRVWITVMRCR